MVGIGRGTQFVGVLADNCEPPLPPAPTDAPPGSLRKLRVMERRAEQGYAILHPSDAPPGADWSGEVCLDDLRGNRKPGGHYRRKAEGRD